jgi:hypothetical protein
MSSVVVEQSQKSKIATPMTAKHIRSILFWLRISFVGLTID